MHHSDAGSQYTSFDYAQTLDDHWVLASIGTVGDAYDNALAESFVDSFKTELISDRVWRSRAQLELAVVEYIGWFNTAVCTPRSATGPRPNRSPRRRQGPKRCRLRPPQQPQNYQRWPVALSDG